MKGYNICEKPGKNNLILLESLILLMNFSTCLMFLTFLSSLTNEFAEKQAILKMVLIYCRVTKYVSYMLCIGQSAYRKWDWRENLEVKYAQFHICCAYLIITLCPLLFP